MSRRFCWCFAGNVIYFYLSPFPAVSRVIACTRYVYLPYRNHKNQSVVDIHTRNGDVYVFKIYEIVLISRWHSVSYCEEIFRDWTSTAKTNSMWHKTKLLLTHEYIQSTFPKLLRCWRNGDKTRNFIANWSGSIWWNMEFERFSSSWLAIQ